MTTPDDRIDRIRKNRTNQGHPNEHLSDIEVLLAELDEHNKRLRTQMTAARAQMQRESIQSWENTAKAAAAGVMRPLNGLIYRIQQLPERPPKKLLEELRDAAAAAEATAAAHRGEMDDQIRAAGEPFAELARIRDVVRRQGRALHDAESTGRLPCTCRGCELIRSLDDVQPAGSPSDAAASAPAPVLAAQSRGAGH